MEICGEKMIEQKIDDIFKILKEYDARIKELEALAKVGQLKFSETGLKEGKKQKKDADKPKYKEGSLTWCAYQLKHKYGYFDNYQIRTTSEILNAAKLKLNKTVKSHKVVDLLFGLVKDGELDRDKLPPTKTNPVETYIWFLPNTPREKIEEYKKQALSVMRE